jgi:hypothetical protein
VPTRFTSPSFDAEHAAQSGDLSAALRGFIEAGDRAAAVQLWRGAARSYRDALELDLVRRVPVARLVSIARHVGNQLEWSAYAQVLAGMPGWPHFGCRVSRIVTSDHGSILECGGIGPVLELSMRTTELVHVHPDARFARMPLAMALIILRRGLWVRPREDVIKPARVHVVFDGRSPVWLDERGDWAPL